MNSPCVRQGSRVSNNIMTKKANKNNNKKTSKGQKVSVPVAISRTVKVQGPELRSSGLDIRIKHREYLREVYGPVKAPGEPNVEEVAVNPGLVACFPWLSAIANRYESYTFHKLCLHYMPNCSSSTSGSVILSPDYDVSDGSPDSLAPLQSAPDSVRASVWAESRMDCTASLLRKGLKERYVRSTSTVTTGGDLRLYDAVKCFIATVNMTAAVSVGSLWIEYDVSLRTPTVDISVNMDGSAKFFTNSSTLAAPLGAAGYSIFQDNTIDETISVTNAGTGMKFHRPGSYLINTEYIGTTLNADGFEILLDARHATLSGNLMAMVNAAATYGANLRVLTVIAPTIIGIVSRIPWATLTGVVMRIAPYKTTDL